MTSPVMSLKGTKDLLSRLEQRERPSDRALNEESGRHLKPVILNRSEGSPRSVQTIGEDSFLPEGPAIPSRCLK